MLRFALSPCSTAIRLFAAPAQVANRTASRGYSVRDNHCVPQRIRSLPVSPPRFSIDAVEPFETDDELCAGVELRMRVSIARLRQVHFERSFDPILRTHEPGNGSQCATWLHRDFGSELQGRVVFDASPKFTAQLRDLTRAFRLSATETAINKVTRRDHQFVRHKTPGPRTLKPC